MIARIFAPLALAIAAWGQPPAFEVASFKIAEPITPAMVQSGRLQMGVTIDAQHVRINKLSLYELLSLAYQVKGYQLSGPDWMVMERYDIQAKLPDGTSRGQVPAMLQSLLAQRLGLRVHRENREMAVTALVAGKGGAHLQASPPEEPAPPPAQLKGSIAVAPGGSMASSGSGYHAVATPGAGGNLHIEFRRTTMAGLASYLNRYSERPVIDGTGLGREYDLEIDISGEEVRNAARSKGVPIRTPAAEAVSDPAGVSLPSSLARLGLKLEGRKAPIEVLVVDKVEKVPTEN